MQDAVQMLPVRIRNKYLSETVSRHQFDNLLHARGIQFIKNIV